MRRAPLLLTVVAALALPSSAGAQGFLAPPGNSGIDEYLESIPAAAAGGTRGAPAGRIPRASPGALPRGVAGALRDGGGAQGRALVDLAATSPAPRALDGAPVVDGDGDSPLEAVEALIGADSEGMGAALPLVLAASAAGAAAAVWRRRRAAPRLP